MAWGVLLLGLVYNGGSSVVKGYEIENANLKDPFCFIDGLSICFHSGTGIAIGGDGQSNIPTK
ncbi:unnamed protein product [Eretmochelys imbricata]